MMSQRIMKNPDRWATFDPGTDLSELLEAEVLAGLGHFLDDLSDPVAGQRQVRGSEKFRELVFADEAVVVDVWKRTERGQRSHGSPARVRQFQPS